MDYKAIKYNSREEAMAAFQRMKHRKQEWMERTAQELRALRQEALQPA